MEFSFSGGISGTSLDRMDVVLREGGRVSRNDDGDNLCVEGASHELFVQDVGTSGLVFNGTFHGDVPAVLEYLESLASALRGIAALEDVIVEEADSRRIVWDYRDQAPARISDSR